MAPGALLGNDAFMEVDKLHGNGPNAEALVDVVIVSADMAEMTRACIAELEGPGVASIVVVDNAFDPAAGSAREELARRCTVVALDSPHGFAAANNRGVALGKAPYVLLLNSDILIQPGAIEGLLEALGDHPGAVAAGGRLVDPETLETQSGYRPRPFPSLANFLVIMLGLEELWPSNPITSRYHGGEVDESATTVVDAQPAAAALMVPREDLQAVGGFDERFWFWFEDSDLLLRLRSRGPILYVPQAVFRHLGGGTFSRWSKSQRIRSVYHGILHYGAAHFSRPERALLGLTALAVSLPRVLIFGRSRPEEGSAWRAVAGGGAALVLGSTLPAIAPGPTGHADDDPPVIPTPADMAPITPEMVRRANDDD
jgi:N-acetylglucosaminyl-diphospho-decaprenol L-rhamnosyltransferase